jgi:dolichol kinase
MKKLFEIRRKLVHIFFGALLSLLIYFDLFSLPFWGGILILGIIFSFVLKKYNIPWLSQFIFSFERAEEIRSFPLRGALAFLFGCILSYLLFPKLIAISAIITLFVGDSAACLYGMYLGKIKIPWSPKKHLDATILGVFFSTVFIGLFFPFWKAFLATLAALLFESTISFEKLPNNFIRLFFDDNVFIPLIAGGILFFIA